MISTIIKACNKNTVFNTLKKFYLKLSFIKTCQFKTNNLHYKTAELLHYHENAISLTFYVYNRDHHYWNEHF